MYGRRAALGQDLGFRCAGFNPELRTSVAKEDSAARSLQLGWAGYKIGVLAAESCGTGRAPLLACSRLTAAKLFDRLEPLQHCSNKIRSGACERQQRHITTVYRGLASGQLRGSDVWSLSWSPGSRRSSGPEQTFGRFDFCGRHTKYGLVSRLRQGPCLHSTFSKICEQGNLENPRFLDEETKQE